MKRQPNTYRCGACNGVKPIRDSVYRLWDTYRIPKYSTVVVVCRRCNNLMKKLKFSRVEQLYGYDRNLLSAKE
jgi:hypothetical protein